MRNMRSRALVMAAAGALIGSGLALAAVSPALAVVGHAAEVTTDPAMPTDVRYPDLRVVVDVDFGRTFQVVDSLCFTARFDGDLLDPGESFVVGWPDGGGIGQGNGGATPMSSVQVCTGSAAVELNASLLDGVERVEVSVDADGTADASFRLVDLTVSMYGVAGVRDCTIVGTSGPDTLVGTEGNDVICGLGGDDTVFAKGGYDLVLGGWGRDTLYGGTGRDSLYGLGGRDVLFGSDDIDTLVGGDAGDRAYGGPGNDRLFGGLGDNYVDGGGGNDWIDLTGGAVNVAFGRMGDDDLLGGDGADELHGNYGDDVLAGFGGPDVLYGEGGSDVLYGYGGDRLLGGDGADTLHSSQGAPVTSDYLCGQRGPDTYRWVGPEDVVCAWDLANL